MKIAIIGAGNVGTALGSAWSKAGHQITSGVRKPDVGPALKFGDQFGAFRVPAEPPSADVRACYPFRTPIADSEKP
jgi:hypothetical protein